MDFTAQFEGGAIVDFMFCDSLGRVASGFGLDFDIHAGGRSPDIAKARAQGLPKALAVKWIVRATGAPAMPADVAADWDKIKSIGNPTGNSSFTSYKPHTKLQVTPASLQTRVLQMLDANERTLKANSAFVHMDQWPADAQLALLGLAWNGAGHLIGSGHGTLLNPLLFRFACAEQDFDAAGDLCEMVAAKTGNDSIKRRSAVQQRLFRDASKIQDIEDESTRNHQAVTVHWPDPLSVSFQKMDDPP